MAEDLLFETELTGYEFKSSITNQDEQADELDKPNKWIKYLIIIAFLITWQIVKRTIIDD